MQNVSFLCISRLIRDKGVVEYLDAAREIHKRYPEIQCVLVGPFDTNPSAIKQEELQSYIDDGSVVYVGEQKDVQPYIHNCTAFVLPSYHEGTPKTVLESMACGRPAITTDAPGCRETVTDDLNGYLVPVKNSSAIVEAMEKIISDYTRESGVRSLDKSIAKIARQRAKAIALEQEVNPTIGIEEIEPMLGKPIFHNDRYDIADMVGVVTGLAWTQTGGDILYIESILTPGKGKLSLTGNLGDVMKESATIAFEWVKAHHEELGIERKMFEECDLNIHVPEGAVPKDGPSAGITMVTSITSTYTGRKIKERIAMTGETTLRGRVTAVGGLREKTLVAKRAGITDIILSEENRKDIEEIRAEYVEGLTFHYVKTNNEVLELALQK